MTPTPTSAVAARDSLKRALADWEEVTENDCQDWPEAYAVIDCARDLLAALAAQPAAPAVLAEPLTMQQLNDICRKAHIDFCLDKASSFEMAFARGIEHAHGIGSVSEDDERPMCRMYCAQPCQHTMPSLMFNGLTQGETTASASVAGLSPQAVECLPVERPDHIEKLRGAMIRAAADFPDEDGVLYLTLLGRRLEIGGYRASTMVSYSERRVETALKGAQAIIDKLEAELATLKARALDVDAVMALVEKLVAAELGCEEGNISAAYRDAARAALLAKLGGQEP